MYVLFTAIPLVGHVNPLLRQAEELQRRGCRVAFASTSNMAAHVAAESPDVPFVDLGPARRRRRAGAAGSGGGVGRSLVRARRAPHGSRADGALAGDVRRPVARHRRRSARRRRRRSLHGGGGLRGGRGRRARRDPQRRSARVGLGQAAAAGRSSSNALLWPIAARRGPASAGQRAGSSSRRGRGRFVDGGARSESRAAPPRTRAGATSTSGCAAAPRSSWAPSASSTSGRCRRTS